MSSKRLVTNGYVVTMDDSLPEVPRGAVLVEDGKIAAVGPADQFDGVDADVIDARGGLIMPGMIDTHRHTGASLNRGFGADKSLLEYLSDVFTRFVPALTVDDLHLSWLFADDGVVGVERVVGG